MANIGLAVGLDCQWQLARQNVAQRAVSAAQGCTITLSSVLARSTTLVLAPGRRLGRGRHAPLGIAQQLAKRCPLLGAGAETVPSAAANDRVDRNDTAAIEDIHSVA
ncbi:hypothetical protein [Sphingopyxis sp.]|uniref:hypothetical protein n=1 Tax=Sphingopyxis sp. TaxID=1908224 RepID=UPI0025E5E4CB|nr:hypothetical protein [Sphingopyxis sp.]MBK6413930.1 hypothetical protein [Sphingopyxis sp.]